MTTARPARPNESRSEDIPHSRIPNALSLLKTDHQAVEDLFDEYEHASRKEKKHALVLEICEELTLHAQLEEQAFYPEVQRALGDDADLVDEARVEHASLKWLIGQLEGEDADSDLYAAKVKVLKEYVQHHVREEEKELFPKIRKTDLDLKVLGKKLFDQKMQLQQENSAKVH